MWNIESSQCTVQSALCLLGFQNVWDCSYNFCRKSCTKLTVKKFLHVWKSSTVWCSYCRKQMLSDFLTFADELQAVESISIILRPLAYRHEASCTPATSTHFRLSSSTVCKTDADTCHVVVSLSASTWCVRSWRAKKAANRSCFRQHHATTSPTLPR